MESGVEVNGLESMRPRGEVGGGSWYWYWYCRVVELGDRDRMMVRRAGILLPVTRSFVGFVSGR